MPNDALEHLANAAAMVLKGGEEDFQSWTRVLESRSLNPNSGEALGVRVPVGAVQAKSAFKSPNAASSTA